MNKKHKIKIVEVEKVEKFYEWLQAGLRAEEEEEKRKQDAFMQMIRRDAAADGQYFDEQYRQEQQMLAEMQSDRAGRYD